MKFLIDECLSEELVKLARDRGYVDSSHVRWIGKGGAKDWELMRIIIDDDWTFVTKNSIDFRGPSNSPGSRGQYRATTVHAGLVCLNGPVGMDLDMQIELFKAALDALDSDGDLINKVLEATLKDAKDVEIELLRYALPVA
jgi:Domain of unknown function (DUF5615)